MRAKPIAAPAPSSTLPFHLAHRPRFMGWGSLLPAFAARHTLEPEQPNYSLAFECARCYAASKGAEGSFELP